MKNRLLRKMTSNLLFVISKHDKWEVAAATVRLDQSKTANWFCHHCLSTYRLPVETLLLWVKEREGRFVCRQRQKRKGKRLELRALMKEEKADEKEKFLCSDPEFPQKWDRLLFMHCRHMRWICLKVLCSGWGIKCFVHNIKCWHMCNTANVSTCCTMCHYFSLSTCPQKYLCTQCMCTQCVHCSTNTCVHCCLCFCLGVQQQ